MRKIGRLIASLSLVCASPVMASTQINNWTLSQSNGACYMQTSYIDGISIVIMRVGDKGFITILNSEWTSIHPAQSYSIVARIDGRPIAYAARGIIFPDKRGFDFPISSADLEELPGSKFDVMKDGKLLEGFAFQRSEDEAFHQLYICSQNRGDPFAN